MTDLAPDPGWYPDPSVAGRLRLWDGTSWTGETRSDFDLPEPLLAPTEPPVRQRRLKPRSRRDRSPRAPSGDTKQPTYSSGLLIAFLILFAAGGMYEVVRGSSGRTDVTAAFSAGPSSSTTAPVRSAPGLVDPNSAPVAARLAPTSGGTTSVPSVPVPPGCAGRQRAELYLQFIRQHASFPIASVLPKTQPGPQVCSWTAFHDSRGVGIDGLEVYPTTADAHGIAASPPSGSVSFAIGPVVLTLDASQSTLEPSYRNALTQATASLSPGSTTP